MTENGEEKIIRTGCCHDCGGRCVLKVHVKNGVITRIETDDEDMPQLRACLRGRAYRQRVHHPDRLLYPMKRTGPRGQGQFQRISWDEALDTVASELQRIKATYGNSAILMGGGSGGQGLLHNPRLLEKLLALFGGFTRTWASPSQEHANYASIATYGTLTTGNTRDDLPNSRLIIMWGWNPANTVQDPNTCLWLARAKEGGTKIIGVDPRCTDTIATYADEWIPIRPGTDAAMLVAMAYVMIKEGLQDQKFLDNYTVGFDKFKDYVLGVEDGVPKTPEWAEPITKVPAAVITRLAREYATTKPAALIGGWGPGRSAIGEQYHRAVNVLTALTGNIGIHGGFAAGFMRGYSSRETHGLRDYRNPVEEGFPPRPEALFKLRGGTNPNSARIHYSLAYDAILRGKEGGYPTQPKMIYLIFSNWLNSHPNINKGIQAFKALEFIVCQDNFVTPTAKFADLLFPAATFMERDDLAPPWLGSPYYIYLNKAIEPPGECKTDIDICGELARRLGIEDFGMESEEEELRQIAATRADIASFDDMKAKGYAKINLPEPVVSFKKQIEDPEHHRFPTLSGKIEIYCEHLAEKNNPLLPPIPKYIKTWESYDDPLSQKYPLQLISPHPKRRTHSTLDNVPWLREVEPQYVEMNPADAQERGILDGEEVLVCNDRGKMIIPARVTRRIMPGVVRLSEGAWFNPDEKGVDHGGCPNVLTRDERSPGGAVPMNTCLVQVKKIQGE